MRLIRFIILTVFLAGWTVSASAAEAAAEAAGHAEEGIPASAVQVWTPHLPVLGDFPITNSMVVSWVVALGLILFVQIASRKMSRVPSGAQNFLEWLVESLHDFLEGVIGKVLVKQTFWFFATIFIFVLFSNWIGLIPGFGTIGWGVDGPHGFHVTNPWFRGVNADLNMTLAMSLTFMVCWVYWALKVNGPVGFILHLFAPKGETTGFMKVLMVLVFLVVGVLEVVSIAFRPVSLSFRLYGNIFAGENILEAMSNLVPGWLGSILVPIPFYFMELLVGIVQALVFTLLTAVFTLLICEHDEGHAEAHHH